MATATALVLNRPRELEQRDFELPTVGSDNGILRVEACGLCGTDHEEYTGHLPAPYGFIPGHEVIGIVEAAGDAALERWGVDVGDRVAVEVFMSCQNCDQCRAGIYRRCVHHGLGDMYGFIDIEKGSGLWGGYATHLHLAPDALLLPIPESLDPVIATLFNPLGAGMRWAVEVPETKPGDVVVVLGPGIRGLSAAAAAKSAGAEFVMITGLGPRDAGRLAEARQFGADLAIDVGTDDPVRALKKATGGLADVVVDVTAKAPTAPGQALHLVRPGGTVVLAGTRGSPDVPGFDLYKEIRVQGALGVDTDNYRAAIDLLEAGTYPFAELARETAGFDGIESLVKTMAGETDDPAPIHAVFTP